MKHLKLFVALFAMLALGVGNAWSETITLNNLGEGLSSTSNTTLSTTVVGDYTLNYLQGKKQGNSILLAKGTDGGTSFISNKTPIPGAIQSVTVHINSDASGKTTYHCAFSTTECTSKYVTGSTAVNITGGNNHKYTCSVENASYFCVALGNNYNGQVLKLEIEYTPASSGGDVIVKTLKSIAVEGMTTDYETGDIFTFDGTCTATYSVTKNDVAQEDEQKVVTPTSVSEPDMSTTGEKEVTVTYTEEDVTVIATYTITVNLAEGDKLVLETTGVEGTNYADWSNKQGASGAVYAGNSAGGNNSIQLRKSAEGKPAAGIITTTSGGLIRKVKVGWNIHTLEGRTLNVYGKNSAYTAVSELYDNATAGELLGTIVEGTSTELVINGDFEYVGLVSASGALYLDKVVFVWEENEDPDGPATALENVAAEGKAVKAIVNGQLIIIKNGVQYNAQGQVIK